MALGCKQNIQILRSFLLPISLLISPFLKEVLQKFSSFTQLNWKRDDGKKAKNREMANILSGLDLDEYQAN